MSRSVAIMLAAFAFGGMGACAHTEASAPGPKEKLTIVTGSRLPSTGSARSRGVRIIERQDLDRTGKPVLSEALEKTIVP